ncbi:PD40 domain-containing protein [Candidatus Sumerlaeota bacterium]|nr:PD40 domain-containing protein [Candidatus Sumerlaeota bacterium]
MPFHPVPFPRKFVLLAALLCALATLASAQPAKQVGTTGGGTIWTLKPKFSYNQSSIAIMPFNALNATVESATFPRIIRRDLELSGLFKNVDEGTMQRAVMVLQRDDRAGSVAFTEWTTLGVEYMLRGNLTQDAAGNFRIIVQLYDINAKSMVLNRTFTDRKDRLRDLAHQISDAVIYQVKGIQGVCRTKLLFVSERMPGVREVAITDYDGFNAKNLTSFGKLATMPVWGANGTEIYFQSYHTNRANIYGMQLQSDGSMNFTAGKVWQIAGYGATNATPSWSQAAGRIVMMLSKDGNTELYTTKRDGSDLQRLTETKFTEGSPAWSPDGSQIIYTSNEGGRAQLYIMNAHGGGKRKLAVNGPWNDAASWSPDGRRILFASRNAGANDIFLCDANGGNVRRLTMGQGNNESPCWAPNSTHITFSSDRSGSWQIYMMLDDGSAQNQLTATGRNILPDWGPLVGAGEK